MAAAAIQTLCPTVNLTTVWGGHAHADAESTGEVGEMGSPPQASAREGPEYEKDEYTDLDDVGYHRETTAAALSVRVPLHHCADTRHCIYDAEGARLWVQEASPTKEEDDDAPQAFSFAMSPQSDAQSHHSQFDVGDAADSAAGGSEHLLSPREEASVLMDGSRLDEYEEQELQEDEEAGGSGQEEEEDAEEAGTVPIEEEGEYETIQLKVIHRYDPTDREIERQREASAGDITQ